MERALTLARRSKDIEMKIEILFAIASYLIARRGNLIRAEAIVDQIRELAQSEGTTPLTQIKSCLVEAFYYGFTALHSECLKAVS